MKQSGFTLVELIAVIVILGIIGLIAVPTVNTLLKKSKENLYENQVKMIKASAKKWGIENINRLSETEIVYLDLQELLNEGYIEQRELIDPRNTNKTTNGCIAIRYDESYNKYEYDYSEDVCSELLK